MAEGNGDARSNQVAIVGLAGQFPGARDLEEFWANLREGREAITFFSDSELAEEGIRPEIYGQPNYVRAGSVLADPGGWDAAFFDCPPREAALTDPQQRLFLECAWEALENAGCDPAQYGGRIGVYGGSAMNTYAFNFFSNRDYTSAAEAFQAVIGNDKDYLTTRVSYKLGLTGPSVTVQTACSSSLVAVHLAAQALLNGECDMALAGGVSVRVPHRAGYFHQEGMVFSPDGHCRAYDARGQGTLFGSGAAVVVLKRLAEALADGDSIRAVILGSAINNDGSLKIGYTAPSVEGQAAVIAEALAVAGVGPETIGYVEGHGTGTTLGDPIEVEALTKVFATGTPAAGSCGLGSVKSNLGHLDAAAGVAGLVKTVLMLEGHELVPSLHYERPNPQIDFARSPFYVVAQRARWQSNGTPRRAGVRSFGIGGTNSHVVLEEAHAVPPRAGHRPWQLLVLSAKTPSALEAATDRLAAGLRRVPPSVSLADVAYTLQSGRRAFKHRRTLVCRDAEDAAAALEGRDPKRVLAFASEGERPLTFMFPGGGAQYVGMAEGLYREEPTFRSVVDQASEALRPVLGFDLRQVIYPPAEALAEARERIKEIAIALPALFTVEYALARLWMEWGITPESLIGHSLGEYVAACVSGVFTLEDALTLVAARGRLMAKAPAGAMLSVARSEESLRASLTGELSLAAINGPNWCVVSGPLDAISELEAAWRRENVECRRLHIHIGAHSPLVEPILGEFGEVVRKLSLRPPRIPYVSNVTGTWIEPAQATDPAYWTRHLRQTVRFGDGIAQLSREPNRILLEVGPEQSLSTLVRQHPDRPSRQVVVASLPHRDEEVPELPFLLGNLGRLWLLGSRVDWTGLHAHGSPRRVPLPTYPFERQRYWIEPRRSAAGEMAFSVGAEAPAGAPGEGAEGSALHRRPQLLNAYVPPTTPLEGQVAEIWQRVFAIDKVGIYDNFFELGGTSLLATELTAQLNRATGRQLSVRSVLRAPTVEEICRLIVQAEAQEREAAAARILDKLAQLSEDDARALLAREALAAVGPGAEPGPSTPSEGGPRPEEVAAGG